MNKHENDTWARAIQNMSSGLPRSAYRIIWILQNVWMETKSRMILCASACWSEFVYFAYVRGTVLLDKAHMLMKHSKQTSLKRNQSTAYKSSTAGLSVRSKYSVPALGPAAGLRLHKLLLTIKNGKVSILKIVNWFHFIRGVSYIKFILTKDQKSHIGVFVLILLNICIRFLLVWTKL